MGRWLSVDGYEAKDDEFLKHEAIIEECIESNKELPKDTVKYLGFTNYNFEKVLMKNEDELHDYGEFLRLELEEKLSVRIKHVTPENNEDYPITEILVKDIPKDCESIRVSYS